MFNKPLFSIGFRPFFLLAIWAGVIFPTFWVSIYFGYLDYHGKLLTPVSWHSHEMIFAFVPALFAGFLLTAGPTWTKQDPISGKPLAALTGLWILERILFTLPLPKEIAVAAGLVFLLPLTFMVINYLKSSKKQLMAFGPLLSFFTLAKILMLVGALTNSPLMYIGQDLGLDLVRLLLIIVASRVLPFFVNSKFPDLNVTTSDWIQKFAIFSMIILCLPIKWHALPVLGYTVYGLGILATSIQLIVLKPWASFKEPMIAILLTAYGWIIVSLILEAVVIYNSSMAFGHPNIHALTAGAIGMMAAGIIVRVTLGHTGREIKADNATLFAFAAIFGGALIRVYVPLFAPSDFMKSTHHASGWWTLGFLVLAIRYSKIYFTPRLGKTVVD